MLQRNLLITAIAAASVFTALLNSGGAAAQSSDLYVAADVGVGRYSTSVIQDGVRLNGGSIDKTSTVGGAAIGWIANPNLALELGFADFGKAKLSGRASFPCQPTPSCTPLTANLSGDYKVKSYSLSAIGSMGLAKDTTVFGRVGAARTERSAFATISNLSGSAKEKKTEAVLGVGVSYAFAKNIEGTFEWKWLSDTKFNASTLGIRFMF